MCCLLCCLVCVFVMHRRTPRTPRTATFLPSTTLFRALLRPFILLAVTVSPFGAVLVLAADLVPHYLVLALPAGFFIAVFVSVARLSEENELDAMLASGLSIYRLSRPYIVAGCVFAVLSILIFGFLQPYSRYDYRAILYTATNAARKSDV